MYNMPEVIRMWVKGHLRSPKLWGNNFGLSDWYNACDKLPVCIIDQKLENAGQRS